MGLTHKTLLCFFGLFFRLHTRVPKSDDMYGVVLDEIHQLVQTISLSYCFQLKFLFFGQLSLVLLLVFFPQVVIIYSQTCFKVTLSLVEHGI